MPTPELPRTGMTLVAILRGVVPDRVVAVATLLYRAGLRAIEVPLNSPDPYASIAALAAALPPDCLVGAGTVLQLEQARLAHGAGARLAVAPNCDATLISAALQMGLKVMPGVSTATEAFSALRAGATDLKLFPAVSHSPQHLRALRSVLPGEARVFPVGGIGAQDILPWMTAGAAGFGFGSELFRPEYTLADIERRALELVRAYLQACRELGRP